MAAFSSPHSASYHMRNNQPIHLFNKRVIQSKDWKFHYKTSFFTTVSCKYEENNCIHNESLQESTKLNKSNNFPDWQHYKYNHVYKNLRVMSSTKSSLSWAWGTRPCVQKFESMSLTKSSLSWAWGTSLCNFVISGLSFSLYDNNNIPTTRDRAPISLKPWS